MAIKNIGDMFELRTRGGGDKVLPANGIMLSVRRDKTDKKRRPQLAVAVGSGAMAAARWVMGDRITIDVDNDAGTATLVRVVPVNGKPVSWKLSSRAGLTGKTGGATVKITASESMLALFGVAGASGPYVPSCEITDRGISFDLGGF